MARASITALCLFCGKELSGKQREEGFCSPVHALEYYQARPQDDDLGDVIFRDEEVQDSDEEGHQREVPDPASLEPEIFPAVLELNFDPPPAPMSAPAAKLVSLAGARRQEPEVHVIGPITILAETQFLEAMMAIPPTGPGRPLGLLLADEPAETFDLAYPESEQVRFQTELLELDDQLTFEWTGEARSLPTPPMQALDLRPATAPFDLTSTYMPPMEFLQLPKSRIKPDLKMPTPAPAVAPLPVDATDDALPAPLRTASFAVPPAPVDQGGVPGPMPTSAHAVPGGLREKLQSAGGRRLKFLIACAAPVIVLAVAIPLFWKKDDGAVPTEPVTETPPAQVATKGRLKGRKTQPPEPVPVKPVEAPVAVPETSYPPGEEPSDLRNLILDRKAIEMADDFHMGLSSWTSRKGGPDWRYDPTGFVIPRSLSIFKPSIEMKDYSMEFLTKIDLRAVSWVGRASDFSNYYVVKLVERAGGPLPKMTLVHYPVIAGRAGLRKEVRLPITVYKDTLYRVRMDIRGSNFAVWIQGALVDSWTEDRLPTGGVGFFNASGESARIRWVQLTHQNDTLGKILAYLAPLTGKKEEPAPVAVVPDSRKSAPKKK